MSTKFSRAADVIATQDARISILEDMCAELLAALTGIQEFAAEMVADACADHQEGAPGAVAAIRKWQAVLNAIARAEGR